MKRISSIFLGSVFLTIGTLSAQVTVAGIDSSATVLDHKMEVYEKENIPFKKPIPYAPVREADIMFEKTIWRMVDLREKQNLPLYYPTANIGSRVNLVNLLLKGVESGEITAYDANDVNNEFVRKMSKEEAKAQFWTRQDTIDVANEDGDMIRQVRQSTNLIDEVKLLMVKEKIYFDKKHSVMMRVVVGLCPIRTYSRTGDDSDFTQMEKMKTMWVYMPEARAVLARHAVFNRFNDAQNMSFDDFFMLNRYSGHVYAVSNVYNNRFIDEYAAGLDALYESQRIENEIFDFEQDLWEY